MDLALSYSRTHDGFDLSLDAARADFTHEDTLASAVILSLLCDRTAEASDVEPGADRRGWWADAYADGGDRFGSRLWLLARMKQLPDSQSRARAWVQESLAWLVEDGFAKSVDVAVFVPQRGWLVAQVAINLDGGTRRFRFEWSDALQVWRLAGEEH